MVQGALVLLAGVLLGTGLADNLKHKRQIFREQVSPHTGGKIPEDAFNTDRLALNRLNKEGISVPDGVLLEMRHKESHHSSYRNDPAIAASIVKLVQHPDGRYVPPEGQYPFNNLIESTYIIRPAWGSAHHLVIPPHKTLEVPLFIPNRQPHPPSLSHPRFPSDDILSLTNHLDSIYPDPDLTRIWAGFGSLFSDSPARFLRQAKKPSPPQQPPSQPSLKVELLYPKVTEMPRTSFSCGKLKGKMVPDKEANCQVFHLCHTTGEKESFMCPQGMRFDMTRSQCVHWTKVACGEHR